MEFTVEEVLMLQTNAAACSDQARYHEDEARVLYSNHINDPRVTLLGASIFDIIEDINWHKDMAKENQRIAAEWYKDARNVYNAWRKQ